jgi:hypothetical protein
VAWVQHNWPILIVLGIPLALGGWALTRYRRSGNRDLFSAVLGFTFLALAILGGTLWAAGVPQYVFRRADPVLPDDVWKITQSVTLTLGALGVVAASVITYHRQRSQDQQVQLELSKFDQEKAKYEDDQTHETERRQQERYAQGAQMLADTSPAVRIAGLNVIAALGQEAPMGHELRQTCVNLLCAYLRAASPSEGIDDFKDQPDRYRVVAAEACRLLPLLLPEVPLSVPDVPDGPALDLRETLLIELDLSHRSVGVARFGKATFTGYARFGGVAFTGYADFHSARFTGYAGFVGSTFAESADFTDASFLSETAFVDATFCWGVEFTRARFHGDAQFAEVAFGVRANFSETEFSGAASFPRAEFSGEASFSDATFFGKAAFGGAVFDGGAVFERVTFDGDALFDGSKYGGEASFNDTRFNKHCGFVLSTFEGDAHFSRTTFGGLAGFAGARFRDNSSFATASFDCYTGPNDLDLLNAIFEQHADKRFLGAQFRLARKPNETDVE